MSQIGRVGVISDIHGNCLALDAVLDDLLREPVDAVVCLGDAVQGGPQPAEVVARLRELGCPVVMGNADAWLLTGADSSPNETTTPQQEAVRQWSLSRLSQEDISFIQGFQPTVELQLEGGQRLLCFHGSPASFDDLIFMDTPEEEFQRFLGAHRGAVMCGGHTHAQQTRRIGNYFFFNPGSVGMPYNRHLPEDKFHLDPWAEYAVLTSSAGSLSLDLRRVSYDVPRLLDIYKSSGRPHIEGIVAHWEKGLKRDE
ncbi:MAG TPA: metallophosphoesterase family protein [Chloroflexia bacterium]|jgi:putative phosphoesterase